MTDTVLENELPARPRRRLVTPITAALLAVVLIALGFTAGVLVQKSADGTPASADGTPTSAAGGRSNLAGGGPPGAQQGRGGGQGGGGQATVGEVSSKDGRTLYVKDSDGTTIKVRIRAHAKVARTANAGAKAIHPGDTVIVQGTAGSNGTVKATSVTATASGVQSAGGPPGGFTPPSGG
jgi:hypothetical protein